MLAKDNYFSFSNNKRKQIFNLSIIGLCFIFISLPLMKLRVGGYGLQLYSSIFFAITIFINIIQQKKVFFSPFIIPVTGVLLYFIIASFFSPTLSYSLGYIQQFLRYFLVALLVSLCKIGTSERKFLNWTIQLSGLFIAIYALNNPYFGLDNRLWFYFFDELQDPNYFTMYFILPIMISYQHSISLKSKTIKMFSLFCMLFMVYLVILTGSRGGLLSVSVSLSIVILKDLGRGMSGFVKVFFVVLVVLIFISIVPVFLPAELVARFSLFRVFSTGGSGRIEIWAEYIRLIKYQGFVEFFFGYGFGSSELNAYVAHNQFLSLLYEAGLFGMVVFCMFIFYLLRKAIKLEFHYGVAVIIGLLVQISFVTATIDRYFWICIIVTSAWVFSYKIKEVMDQI